ncbi:MAG: ABC transporter permease [Deltaproteobacteria bacterium]|nr:ABC transporter permease [Deltaproteobacteria bacterium]
MSRTTRFHQVVWAFMVKDAKVAFSYRLQAFFQLTGIFSVAVTFFFLSLMLKKVEGGIAALGSYGGSYFGFAIVGIAVSVYMDASLRTFANSIRTAQMTGTFEAMLMTRASISSLMAGSSAYTLLLSWLRAGAMVGIGVALFDVQIHLAQVGALLLVFALTALATLALGVFSAGFIVLFNKGDPLTMAISGLSWLLSGVIYPRQILPIWVQRVADLLPMTHALEATRLLLLGGSDLAGAGRSLIGLAIFSAIALPVSITWFVWAVDRARSDGSLARY